MPAHTEQNELEFHKATTGLNSVFCLVFFFFAEAIYE